LVLRSSGVDTGGGERDKENDVVEADEVDQKFSCGNRARASRIQNRTGMTVDEEVVMTFTTQRPKTKMPHTQIFPVVLLMFDLTVDMLLCMNECFILFQVFRLVGVAQFWEMIMIMPITKAFLHQG
jgi:hypothetical protein